MTVEQDGDNLECEFRHLSLAEYMTALHVHITGDSLKGFPRDRKELILQYLSGLASISESKDQLVVKDFLHNMGSTSEARDALEYLKFVQKMRGEWYNQQGRCRHRRLLILNIYILVAYSKTLVENHVVVLNIITLYISVVEG